jgi:hypothetical protein
MNNEDLKVGVLVRVKKDNLFGTNARRTQIWKIVSVDKDHPQGRCHISYHSGFPVIEDGMNFYYTMRAPMLDLANLRNQYTKNGADKPETTEEGEQMEERYTLGELKEIGLITEDSLEDILVTKVKNLIDKRGNPEISKIAAGIDTLGVPVGSIERFKELNSVIDQIGSLL